jgi:riboflavin synthase
MFTGLVQAIGEVSACSAEGQGVTVAIATELGGELAEGDSIAVSGVCLTATSVSEAGFTAHAMAETLRTSSLAGLQAGSKVNLELPLRIGDRLGGHIVQGHVDCVGTVVETVQEGASRTLTVELDGSRSGLLAPKGSVTLDGVSLTISGLAGDPGQPTGRFSVSLIPETLTRTTLGGLQVGSQVNVELDVLAKHVQRLIASNLVAG